MRLSPPLYGSGAGMVHLFPFAGGGRFLFLKVFPIKTGAARFGLGGRMLGLAPRRALFFPKAGQRTLSEVFWIYPIAVPSFFSSRECSDHGSASSFPPPWTICVVLAFDEVVRPFLPFFFRGVVFCGLGDLCAASSPLLGFFSLD